MEKISRFGVSIPKELVRDFDESIRSKGYSNRSEAIRDMMRDYLVEREWEAGEGEVVGTVTIVYDHHVRDLSNLLTNLQHDSHESVLCSTHVHLDHHNCLEVIIVKGTADQVRTMADRLISVRGVKHGKLTCTTCGERLK